LSFPILHLVGRRLPTELQTFSQELQRTALVYLFPTTAELLDGWRLARKNGPQLAFAPNAVVWLQSRAGEYQQAEVAEVQTLDPLARPIVVAGCWCEGEPRSGRLLAAVTRIYWHQGAAALLRLLPTDEQPQATTSQWIAIHATHYGDYQGIAGVCESLGHRTLWQAEHWPSISSEPAARIFCGWSSWQAWQDNNRSQDRSAHTILLQDFPRPADHQRAAAEGIAAVVAQPFSAMELERAISPRTILKNPPLRRCDPFDSYKRKPMTVYPQRRSA
jgi:hypothetical protein